MLIMLKHLEIKMVLNENPYNHSFIHKYSAYNLLIMAALYFEFVN